jgi:hypothetical protein
MLYRSYPQDTVACSTGKTRRAYTFRPGSYLAQQCYNLFNYFHFREMAVPCFFQQIKFHFYTKMFIIDAITIS